MPKVSVNNFCCVFELSLCNNVCDNYISDNKITTNKNVKFTEMSKLQWQTLL